MRGKAIMIQGTMSNVGKSLITAGLCRIFYQDGYRVAPFKSQNMALNSYITREGLEMGRAQAVQAEAAGVEPVAAMNPILLKPTTDMGSQVIVNGRVFGNMRAVEYFRKKREFVPVIRDAYEGLAATHDIIVIEGAGSPAEINLKQDDIVNMGMAQIADAPVILVGDIDRGGVFAQLVGTVMLLTQEERDRIGGLVINKFRGDRSLLTPGLSMLEERCGKPVLGVMPYLDVKLEEEDSLGDSLLQSVGGNGVDVAVIRLPRISNYTDFQPLSMEPEVSLRYVSSVRELGTPDLILLPGTKNTICDMKWLRESGFEAALLRLAGQSPERAPLIFGICGGYQMLGQTIRDPEGVEGGGEIAGLGLLPIDTCLQTVKTRRQARGNTLKLPGVYQKLSGLPVCGYEIHMGKTVRHGKDLLELSGEEGERQPEGCFSGNVAGSYLHGIFDSDAFRSALVELLCRRKGLDPDGERQNYSAWKEREYERLAACLREHLELDLIYRMLNQ